VEISLKREGQVLTVFLSGELDHHTVSKVKETVDTQLTVLPVRLLVLDMAGITFMDSSGIGLIVGRYNRISNLGGKMKITNPNDTLLKILKMSGIGQLMKIG